MISFRISKWLDCQKDVLFLKSKALSRKHLYEFLEDSIEVSLVKSKSPCKVLNIGAGGEVGKFVNRVSKKIKCSIVSVDIDPDREPDIVCDVRKLPFNNSEFDCVICAEVLEHVLFPRASIKEMHRVLKKEGTLILTTKFIFPLHDRPGDYFRFTKYGLRALFSNFSSFDIREQLNWIDTMAVLIMRLLKEDRRWIKWASIPIYSFAKLIQISSSLFEERLTTDYITLGYFVIARK